jgi:hypothetical protein
MAAVLLSVCINIFFVDVVVVRKKPRFRVSSCPHDTKPAARRENSLVSVYLFGLIQ